VSHTDNDVTFKDTYTDQYWDEQEHVVTHSRLFETVLTRNEFLRTKKKLHRYQKDFRQYLKTVTSYEHYWQLLKENLVERNQLTFL
jgi:hypothetical protein